MACGKDRQQQMAKKKQQCGRQEIGMITSKTTRTTTVTKTKEAQDRYRRRRHGHWLKMMTMMNNFINKILSRNSRCEVYNIHFFI